MPGWREDLDGPEPEHCGMPLALPVIFGAAIVLAVLTYALWRFFNH